MAAHKYKIGQIVRYAPGRSISIAAASEYKVVKLLPASEGDNQYRIKSPNENFERMARETDLSRK